MAARTLARLGAAALVAAAAACGPARDDAGTPDSSPGQAGAPVPPPAGATAEARPAPALPDGAGTTVGTTVGATTAARPTPAAPARKPTASRPASGARAPADTLEYDRAIEYKPDPRRELPAVGETKKP